MKTLTSIFFVLNLPLTRSLNEYRAWSDRSICSEAQDPHYPYAYSKYLQDQVEPQGRVNSNLQDFRHECVREGGLSKCHICEPIVCGSDTGLCDLQLQGVNTTEMSINIPTVTDMAWAVGGRFRTDYGGPSTSHFCVFITGGDCLLPTTSDFSSCVVRCFGYGSNTTAVSRGMAAPILVEPYKPQLVDTGPFDIWVYPRNCSDLTNAGLPCIYLDPLNRVPLLNPQGFTFTLAGSGVAGFDDGGSSSATFFSPEGVAVDDLGFVYVADTANNAVRVVSPEGQVSTIAGGGPLSTGFRDGNCSFAQFSQPKGIDVMRSGDNITLIIADTGNHRIRRIDLYNDTGLCSVSCLSGLCYDSTPTPPDSSYVQITPLEGYQDGAPAVARYSSPQDVLIFPFAGDTLIIVADTSNFIIRMINLTTGNVSTLAGSVGVDPTGDPIPGCLSPCLVGIAGRRDGNISYAEFYTPQSLGLGPNSTIYVADDSRLRLITMPNITTELFGVKTEGWVSTIAGTSLQGENDGFGTEATFFDPSGLFVTADNIVYLADSASCHIRRVSPIEQTAQPVTCSTTAADVIRPSGCTSYDEIVDKTGRKISSIEANILYNYGPPYVNDSAQGKYIKPCVGSPPVELLDKYYLANGGENLVVDDNVVSVDEASYPGTAILVLCPPGCASSTLNTVQGTMLYAENSSLCVAAIHDGSLPNDGGILLITLDRVNATEASFIQGTTSFGINSTDLGSFEQMVFSTSSFNVSVSITHTSAGHPAAKLDDGCGFGDGQPTSGAYFNSPAGIAAAKNTSLSDVNFLYVADSNNHRIRGISASCTQICENGGRCTGPDICSCLTGWAGEDCTQPICSSSCPSNQLCVGPDMCACKPGFTGSACDTPLCSQTCHNEGICSSPDTCSCSSGWFDSNCTTPVCTQTCGNGGNCTAPSLCSCPSDWTGFDCRTPVCAQTCQNGGLCIAPNTCICSPQWSGANCTSPVCSQGFFVANKPSPYPHLYSSSTALRTSYRPCDLEDWCVATNEFECDQRDISYSNATVPSGGVNRSITGRKKPPTLCMMIELPLTYKIPFALLRDDNSTTGYLRYSPFTFYNSNDSNPWRGYTYSPLDVGHTGPWTYSADRQIALVQYITQTEGVYACANNGNCSAPDVCECATGWIGFDCRTPVCTQGYYQPQQTDFVSGLGTYSELDDFSRFLGPNTFKLRWPYSNPSYNLSLEFYLNASIVVRMLQLDGNISYLGQADWSTGRGVPELQGGYRCSIRAMTQWENLDFMLDEPNYYSRYMDETVQADGQTYTYWQNMSWPPTYSHSPQLDQHLFNLTFAYTDEGFRRLGIWSRIASVGWEYGACLLEFSRTCPLDISKTLDLLTNLTSVLVMDTDRSFRPIISYNDQRVMSQGRWNAVGGECVDEVVRGCFNNGTCIAPDTCQCPQGWSGWDCSVPVCAQICEHHGNCTLPNICTCEKGWSGMDCSIALCAQECQNGGICVAPDTCQCLQWPNEFRDGRLGGGRPLFRKFNGDPQNTGWTGFDCSVPICVQAKDYLFAVQNTSSIGYQILGGHPGGGLTCNDSAGNPVATCPQYDKKLTSNDGRSFYTGCGYDPIDTGCCIVNFDGVGVDCYKCPASSLTITAHTTFCSGPLTVLSGFVSQKELFFDFLDFNQNLMICGEYHLPRRFVDAIEQTDYGTAVYFQNPFESQPFYSSRNYLSNLTSNRYLCNRQFWTQGDFIDNGALSSLTGAGTHFPLGSNRQFRVNDPNYIPYKQDITGTTYLDGPQLPGEGLFACSNGGSCIGPDYCSCIDGWAGFDCSVPLCRHIQESGAISSCLNGGICAYKDSCQCIQTPSILWEVYPSAIKGMTGWTGSDCSIPMCSQGNFDPFCTDLPQAPAGEGCFRCSNGGNCTAPDICTCAEGWTGFDCKTPICEVVADALTRTQLPTIFEDKIIAFESDPCGVSSIYGTVPWNGIQYSLGNCTLPNQCTCLCTMRYDSDLCSPSDSVNNCRGPWQDPMIQVRDILSQRGVEYIFGTTDCEKGYEGNVDALDRFTTCHQIIYSPTYLERFSVNIILGTILGAFFGSLIYFFVRRRMRRKALLEKIEQRKLQRGEEDEDEDEEGDPLLEGDER